MTPLGSTVTAAGRTECGWRKRPSTELKRGEMDKHRMGTTPAHSPAVLPSLQPPPSPAASLPSAGWGRNVREILVLRQKDDC